MGFYQLRSYRKDGGFMARFEFSAADELEAMRAAEQYIAGPGAHYELWCGNRWVQTWASSDDVRAQPAVQSRG